MSTQNRPERSHVKTGRRPLTILRSSMLSGPNAWSQRSVARFTIDAGSVGPISERELQFDAGRSPTEEPINAESTVHAGQLFSALVLQIQQEAGHDVSLALSWQREDPGYFEIVCEYEDAPVAQAASALAAKTLNHHFVQPGPEFDFAADYERDIVGYMTRRTEPQARDLVIRAARHRGIPVRIDDHPYDDVVELGTGKYQRRYWRSRVTSTGLLGGRIAERKPLTNHILRERGLPVPNGQVASSARSAVAAAETIGYPVIVKPVSLTAGWGVTPNLTDAESVRQAYAVATGRSGGSSVLVEEFLPGREFRVLLIDDKLAGVVERVHSHVVGDGVHTVRQLIDAQNEDPRRQPDHPSRLTLVEITDEVEAVLAGQKLTPESVPPDNVMVRLRRLTGPRYGGFSINRTSEIHPDNVRLARLAAQAIGLDICGIDLITTDISEPIWRNGGAILEVNSSPGLVFHMNPTDGEPYDPGPAILNLIYPPGTPFRVPVLAIAGSDAADQVAETIERILRTAGRTVGMASSKRTTIDGLPLRDPANAQYTQTRAILSNPAVECAVLVVGPTDAEERGLGFSEADVVVITSAPGDSPREWRDIAEVLIATAGERGTVILNAADPRCAALEQQTSGPLILVSQDEEHSAVRAHLDRGHRAVVMKSSAIVLMDGRRGELSILEPHSIGSGDPPSQFALLMAVAAAIAADVPPDVIRTALI